jgi:predicted DNA-binding protein
MHYKTYSIRVSRDAASRLRALAHSAFIHGRIKITFQSMVDEAISRYCDDIENHRLEMFPWHSHKAG